jgi:tetratricopeptide (TPR) repeat protein
LAVVYLDSGRAAEAEPLLRRALTILERTRGPEHYSVGGSLYRLAQVCLDTGRSAEAEPLLERALAILGKELPAGYYLATVRENCADLLDRLGRANEAATLRARAQSPP